MFSGLALLGESRTCQIDVVLGRWVVVVRNAVAMAFPTIQPRGDFGTASQDHSSLCPLELLGVEVFQRARQARLSSPIQQHGRTRLDHSGAAFGQQGSRDPPIVMCWRARPKAVHVRPHQALRWRCKSMFCRHQSMRSPNARLTTALDGANPKIRLHGDGFHPL
jgi:hypothetical protein